MKNSIKIFNPLNLKQNNIIKPNVLYSCMFLNNKNFSTQNNKFHTRVEVSMKGKSNPITQPDEWSKEFTNQWGNWGKVHTWLLKWTITPFYMGWWNQHRDIQAGNARYNCGGAYPNTLAKLFYRSKALQSNFMLNFAMKRLDSRKVIEFNRAENIPKITSNSVFVYKDSSNWTINRRAVERLFVVFVGLGGLNFTGILLYTFIALYFAAIVSLFVLD